MGQRSDYFFTINSLDKVLSEASKEDVQTWGLFGTYKLISANLLRFLPKINKREHFELIKSIQYYRQKAIFDQEFMFLLDHIEIYDKSGLLEKCKEKGQIICTYHTGSYRMLIAWLAKMNIKFCLVTEQRFIKTQGKKVQKLFSSVKSQNTLTRSKQDLIILDAENPGLFRQLISLIKMNYNIVFYIDGNTGALQHKVTREKLIAVSFLSSCIYVRKGIAFLSCLTKTPILTVLCKSTGITKNELHVEPIPHSSSGDKKRYIKDSTKKMYSILENFVRVNPSQWEGWFYVHKFIQNTHTSIELNNRVLNDDVLSSMKNKVICFNDQDYEMVRQYNNLYLLFDLKNYKVSKISSDLFKVLIHFNIPRRVIANEAYICDEIKLGMQAIKELLLNKILIPGDY